MNRTRTLGFLLFGAIAAFGVAAYAAETQTHPSDLFKQNCAKCHGESGRGDTIKGRNLHARNFTDAEWQAGVSNSELVHSVTNGKGDDMPPFGKKLTPDQIESLVKNDVRGFTPTK